MKTHYRLEVELTLLGPILTKGGKAPEPGIDAPLARDADGQPMLPYSLVKGKVLDALRDLHPEWFQEYRDRAGGLHYRTIDARAASWLGNGSADGGEDPDRGRLRFSDFTTNQKGTNTAGVGDPVIERIRIDRETGSVTAGALAMVEAPFGYGEEVIFTGRVEFIAEPDEATRIRDTLREALEWVPAFGALRTVGFGRNVPEKLKAELKPATERTGTPPSGPVLPLRLTLDRPLCVVGPKHSGNHFNSLTHIPGAVLKGAVARLIQELTGHAGRDVTGVREFPALCSNFTDVRFAEARPIKKGDDMRRPVDPPLSLVGCPGVNNRYWDVALWGGPKLIHGLAPVFDIDWKYELGAYVAEQFGRVDVPLERRTRTAIDRGTGRAADTQLFSYGLATNVGFVWESAIGLEHISAADRTAVVHDLRKLLAHGLPNIGKTRATGAVEWLKNATPRKVRENVDPPDGLHVVTLQTDCLVTDPKLLKANDPASLAAAYQAFWSDVSRGALELVRYFTRQTLHGGHLSRRTRQARYEPFLVTDRGSTFVLKPTGAGDPTALLAGWRECGLPAAKWVEMRYAQNNQPLWLACPFLPHVGFGEVAVDLECHTKHSAAE